MVRYQILIEYDGSKFIGWQKQKNGISIQSTIEKVLKKILKKKILVYGSGRTDAGVHAVEQSAHFDQSKKIAKLNNFVNSINYFLNQKKISILNIKKKSKKFHARFNAKKRIYEYIIMNRQAPLSLDFNRAWHVRSKLDINLMQKAAKFFRALKIFLHLERLHVEQKQQ